MAADLPPPSPPASIRIDSDAATEVDELGREQYARTLARIIQTADTPLVLAMYGAWGSGKTSLMMQVRRLLDPLHDRGGAGDGVRTVWFDPWMHQFDDSPALGLLHAAVDQLGLSQRADVRQALTKLAIALGEDIQLPFIGVRVGRLLKIRDEMASDDFNRREERARLRAHFHDVLKATGAPQRRVTFFIDDLDRCQPGLALALLEALKLYLDLPGCVYVLGIDREPLEAAVAAQYATLGLRTESYLDKIIQLPFAIPAIDETAMGAFVARRLPEELAGCAELLAEASADEPRSVKRVANTLLVNHELAREATFTTPYDPRVLAMVVLIQNLAPSLYRQLRLNPELIGELFVSREAPVGTQASSAGPEESLWELYVAPNPRLERALRLVEGYVDDPGELDLVPYLTLTSLAPSDTTTTAASARGRIFLSFRRGDTSWAKRIRDALADLGWELVDQSDMQYGATFSDSLRDVLAVTDVVVVVIGGEWRTTVGSSDEGEFELIEKSGLPIVPVLVDDVQMTPEFPRVIVERQAVSITDDAFGRGIAVLDRALSSVVTPGPTTKARPPSA